MRYQPNIVGITLLHKESPREALDSVSLWSCPQWVAGGKIKCTGTHKSLFFQVSFTESYLCVEGYQLQVKLVPGVNWTLTGLSYWFTLSTFVDKISRCSQVAKCVCRLCLCLMAWGLAFCFLWVMCDLSSWSNDLQIALERFATEYEVAEIKICTIKSEVVVFSWNRV